MRTYFPHEIHRGELYYADLRPVVGSEQGGIRPVLILQNNVGNRHSPTVIAAPVTSKMGKARLPTHVSLNKHSSGLHCGSTIAIRTHLWYVGGVNSRQIYTCYDKGGLS